MIHRMARRWLVWACLVCLFAGAAFSGAPRMVSGTDEAGPRGMHVARDFVPVDASLSAMVVFVDDDAAPGGDGLSWATAFDSLDDAVDAVNGVALDPNNPPPPAEIRIAQGLYKPSDPVNGFTIRRTHVSVNGGFAGVWAPDPDANDPAIFETVISGDIAGNDPPVGSFAPRDSTEFDDNVRYLLRLGFPSSDVVRPISPTDEVSVDGVVVERALIGISGLPRTTSRVVFRGNITAAVSTYAIAGLSRDLAPFST